MHIREIFSQEDEDQALQDGLITIRPSGGLKVYNYSDKAAVNAESWDNPAVLNSRGIITDSVGGVLARPWKKFFNHNQPQAGELDFQAPVEVTDKADGSLGVLFIDDPLQESGVGISTRGSLDSDQAIHAQKLLNKSNSLWDGYTPGCLTMDPNFTPLVEIVYPGNRIVLNYGEVDTLILLGGVFMDSGKYVGPHEAASIISWNGTVTAVMTYETLQEALEAKPRPNAEGLVIRFLKEDKLVKIKQSDYILMHRAIFGMNELAVWSAMMNDVSLEELLEPLPDEVHPWVKDVWEGFTIDLLGEYYKHYFGHRDIAAKLERENSGWYTRKDFAIAAVDTELNTSVLFQLEDDQHDKARKTILKTLRPTGGGERPILETASE